MEIFEIDLESSLSAETWYFWCKKCDKMTTLSGAGGHEGHPIVMKKTEIDLKPVNQGLQTKSVRIDSVKKMAR